MLTLLRNGFIQREKAWRSAGLIERKVQFRPDGANAFSVELT